MNYEKTAKKIIESNFYMTLATTDGNPWIAPLFYAIDKNYDIYFISPKDSIHVQHIMKNPKIAIAIFDSTQKEGTATGLQIEGVANPVDEKDHEKIRELFHNKKYKTEEERKKYPMISNKYKTDKVFKIETLKFYMPDEEAWERDKIDKRREVKIK